MSEPQPVIVYEPRWRGALLGFAVAITGGLALGYSTVETPLAHWVSAGLALLFCGVPLWRLSRTGPDLLIDDEGVFDRLSGVRRKILWQDIESARLTGERSEQCIALRLKNRASEVELRTYLWGHAPQEVLQFFLQKIGASAPGESVTAPRWPSVFNLVTAALVLGVVLAVAIWSGPSMWWASVVFFLILAAIPLWTLTRKGPEGEEGGPDLLIDDEGVWDRLSCDRKIPWRDIRSVRIVGGDQPGIALRLNHEERYISARQRFIFGSEIVLRTHLLERDAQEVLEEFKQRIGGPA